MFPKPDLLFNLYIGLYIFLFLLLLALLVRFWRLECRAVGGHDHSREFDDVFEQFEALAEAGDRSAQYHLGVCYFESVGFEKNYAKAFKWASLAAAQGDEDAELLMATFESVMTTRQIEQGKRLRLAFKPRRTRTLPAAPAQSEITA
jgi:hypothetical protein